jgi:N-acetylglutamate synthase-like GNAT family acetyltransferase
MTYKLRSALQTDSGRIRDLVIEVEINPSGLDWRRFVLAVDDQDSLLGCGQIKPHGNAVLELASIAVRAKYQKQGIARALIEHLLAGSPRPIYLMCPSSMGAFYEKFAFHKLDYDRMPRYFQRVSRVAGVMEALDEVGETLFVMKLE